jgi:hypothetical protein
MLFIKRQAMKPGKIVSFDEYRKERQGRELKVTAGIGLPPADRLWELLDRNISISVWSEQMQVLDSRLPSCSRAK